MEIPLEMGMGMGIGNVDVDVDVDVGFCLYDDLTDTLFFSLCNLRPTTGNYDGPLTAYYFVYCGYWRPLGTHGSKKNDEWS